MTLTKDHMRAVEGLHTELAKLMHTHYTEVHGVVIDSDIAFVDITTMGEVITSFSNPSVSYTFTLDQFSGPALIDYSLPVAYAFVKKALGEKVGGPLTEEERKAMNEVFKRDLQDLLSVWEPVEKLTASDAQLETNPEYLENTIARNETVLLIAVEIHGPDFSGLVNMAYPVGTLESVVGKLEEMGVAAA